MSKKFIFIVDTDEYAGNFERDMCAYMTGIIGDCGVGDDFAALYHLEVPADKHCLFDDYIELRADDHGCARPTSCWPTEGFLSVGYDKAVRKEDWNQAEADAAYQKENAEIYRGYRKQTEAVDPQNPDHAKLGWTEKSKAEALARHDKEIARALKEKAPKSKPNNSVAIFFEKKPTQEMIELMKERANKFAEAKRMIAKRENLSWDLNFKLKIYGFRLTHETTRSKSHLV